MIRHCVFLNLRSDHDAAELQATLKALGELCQRLDGAGGFEAGPNRDYEGRSQAFDAGFTIDFDTRNALQHYGDHPEHRALGARLVAQCDQGAAGIMVFDLDVPGQ